jgi:hypothetical protein
MGDSKSTSNSADSKENQKVETKSTEDKSAKTENIEAKEEELNLSDEQWEQVFKHSRFKQINEEKNEYKTKLEQIEAEAEKSRQKKLKEEGKYQELLEAKDGEIKNLTSSVQGLKVELSIARMASQLKVVDTDAVIRLIDQNKLNFDKEGNPTNMEDVVKELLSEKPYLVSEGSDVKGSTIGSNANTTTEKQSGEFVITKSELRTKLQDHEWYTANKEKIEQWKKEGRIDYSR